MFITRYIIKVFNTYARGILKNIENNSVYLNIFKSFIEFKNIELDDNIINYFKTLIPLSKITIGKIRITIPWTEIYSKPCEIYIEDIIILFTDPSNINIEEIEIISKGKQKIIEFIENFSQKSLKEPQLRYQGFLERLKQIILRNITLIIRNCIIKFKKIENNTISATLKFEKLICMSSNSIGESCFITDDSLGIIYRIINIQGLSFFISFKKTYKNIQYETFINNKNFIKTLNKEVKEEIKEFGYIIKPSIVELFCSLQYQNSNINIGGSAIIKSNDGIDINIFKLKNLLYLTNYIMSLWIIMKKYSDIRPKFRPNTKISKSCVEWWNYAIYRVKLNNNSLLNKKKFNWKSYKEWKQQCEDYYTYYLSTINAPWISNYDIDTIKINKVINSLSIKNLIQLRKQAQYTLEYFYISGKVLPRYYSDKNSDNKIVVVEIFKKSIDSLPLYIDLSFSLNITELQLCFEDKNNSANLIIKDFCINFSYSDRVIKTILSIGAIGNSLHIVNSFFVKENTMEPLENIERFTITYIQDITDITKEVLITLNSFRLKYEKEIFNKLLSFILENQLNDIFQNNHFFKNLNNNLKYEMKLKFDIQNIVLGFGEFEICIENLNIFPFLQCSHLYVTEVSNLPFIVLNNFLLNFDYSNQETIIYIININNMFIYELLSGFYALRNIMMEIYIDFNNFLTLIKEQDEKFQITQNKKLLEIRISSFIINFSSECDPLEIKEFTININKISLNWLIYANFNNIKCNSVLSNTKMNIMISKGKHNKWDILNNNLSNSKANLVISLLFSEGKAKVNNHLLNLLEFLDDLAWVLLFPADKSIPIFYDKNINKPSIEAIISFSNFSFTVFGEPSCTWKSPFCLLCNGNESLIIKLKRFSDTRMNIILTLSNSCSWSTKDYSLLLQSNAEKGNIRLELKWKPPSSLDLKPHYLTLITSIFTTERSFIYHLPALQEMLRQFNESGTPINRLKSIGSRIHFGLRNSSNYIYSNPFWPYRNIIELEVKNAIILYYLWGKFNFNYMEEIDVHLRICVPLFKLKWTLDGLNRSMFTEIILNTGIPRIVKTLSIYYTDISLNNSNFMEIKLNYNISYDTNLQNEEIIVNIKKSQEIEYKNFYIKDNNESQKEIKFQENFIISFEEVYHLLFIAKSFFTGNMNVSSLNSSPNIVESPRRVRNIEVNIAPFAIYSNNFKLAFISWEGISAIFNDKKQVISTKVFSLLFNESLQITENNDKTVLWKHFYKLKKSAVIMEIIGNSKREEDLIILSKFLDINKAELNIGGILFHICEEILPLLLNQILKIYKVCNYDIPVFPSLSSEVNVEINSKNTNEYLTININEIHFGFMWKSRISGLYGELRCTFFSLILKSNTAITLDHGNIELKWYNTIPVLDNVGSLFLLFHESDNVISLIEKISIMTKISNNGNINVIVSPIYINLITITYLHIIELLGYHIKFDIEDNSGLESGCNLSTESVTKTSATSVESYSSPAISFYNMSENTLISPSLIETMLSSTDISSNRKFILEFPEILLSINDLNISMKPYREEKPLVWLNLKNTKFEYLFDKIFLVIGNMICGCQLESHVISIYDLKLGGSKVTMISENLSSEISFTLKSLIVKLSTPSILMILNQIINFPAETIAPLYWNSKPLNCEDEKSNNNNNNNNNNIYHNNHKKRNRNINIITINKNVWELNNDLILSRNGGSVLVFSNLNTNNIHLKMNGYSIIIEPLRKSVSDIVMILEGGISLTFSNGRFVLPSSLIEHKQFQRMEKLGEEVLLLPFMAIGEASYIRCCNIRYATANKSEIQEKNDLRYKKNIHPLRWRIRCTINSLIIHIFPQREQSSLQINVSIDANTIFYGLIIEQGEISIQDFNMVACNTNSSLIMSPTSITTTSENKIINPVSIQIYISEYHNILFSISRLIIDTMISDILIINAIAKDFLDLTNYITSYKSSPAEREYELQIQQTLGWKISGLKKNQDTIDNIRQKEEIQKNDVKRQQGKPKFLLAVFIPFIQITLSTVKYPLLQIMLSDFVWKETIFRMSRNTLLQNQQLQLRIYGKGRWDTVIPAKAIINFEAVQYWSKQTKTNQIRLQCDGLAIYVSRVLLFKMKHIHYKCLEINSAIMKHLNQIPDPVSPLSYSTVLISSVNATHRFINTFQDVFYLMIDKNSENGEIIPLPSGTTVDITIPYNQADDIKLYLYPRYCIELDEFGRHIRNEIGIQRDMQFSHVFANQLRYGHAVGLVVDDLLVVMSCAEIESSSMMMMMTPPLSAFNIFSPNSITDTTAKRRATITTNDNDNNNNNNNNNTKKLTSSFSNSSLNSWRRVDDTGLVVVRIHPRTALYNGSGMILEIQQYLLGESDEIPLGNEFLIVPPNSEYPLSGTCSKVEIRISIDSVIYTTSFSTLSLESGVFLDLKPSINISSRNIRNNNLPVSLFLALQRFTESGSTMILLLPRMTVINHIGLPIKLSLWQEVESSITNMNSVNSEKSKSLSLWPKWGKKNLSNQRLKKKIAEHEALPHKSTIGICQCSYKYSLLLSLSFIQTGGEIVETQSPVKVCSSLKRKIDSEPCLVHMKDSTGRKFYVQITILHRTIILSVGLWVMNLTEYPILLTDNYNSRRLSAGQMPHTGIPPSTGVPFLIGCRPREFNSVFLTLGLDGEYSDNILIQLGAHGVAQSARKISGLTRSCNYQVQFPRIQEGQPVILLLTPRWVFVNNTNRRLKLHFESPGIQEEKEVNIRRESTSKKISIVKRAEDEKEKEEEEEKEVLNTGSSASLITLRPGEHHFSCIGTEKGNKVSFQDTLEDTVPSITSLSNHSVRHKNAAAFFKAHRTAVMSVDNPGHATFNLWTSLKKQEIIPAVVYGARIITTTTTKLLSKNNTNIVNEDDAFVTGRLSVTVQHRDNVLAVVMNSIHATNISIQNRTRSETIAIRQSGSQRRIIIPSCQNRFFLWEDYRSDPIIAIHIIGRKGAWFEVDFSRGICQVQRHSTSNETANEISSFTVRACTSTYNAQHINIIITNEVIPLHAFLDEAWNTSLARTLSFPSLELVLFGEERLESNPFRISVQLRDLQLQILDAGNTNTISVMLQRLQVVDVREQATVVLHRAALDNSNATQNYFVSSNNNNNNNNNNNTGTGGFLNWFWRGEEVPQYDFQSIFTAMKSASGITRVTELSFTLSPFAVDVSDHFIVALWHEFQGVLLLFFGDGNDNNNNNNNNNMIIGGRRRGVGGVGNSISSSLISRHAFSQGLVARIRRDNDTTTTNNNNNNNNNDNSNTTTTNNNNNNNTNNNYFSTSTLTTTKSFKHKRFGGNEGPALLFIDQAHISRITVFITFMRHKPDPLWPLLGMYTFMIPKKIHQLEFSWPTFSLKNDATTWGLLFANTQRWFIDGALRQWTKVTRIGKVVDKIKGDKHRLVRLARAPEPMLSEVNNFDSNSSSNDSDDSDSD